MRFSRAAQALVLCAISIALLTAGFTANSWRVAEQSWFDNHQRDMESHIVARMVQSRQAGIFSFGGLPGLGSLDATPAIYAEKPFADQYRAYTEGLAFGAYTTYDSQVGGQGILFSILDKLIPATSQEKLSLFHALTALLSAILLAMIILWFYLEFGLAVAVSVLLSAVFSQWLVVFGRNLWWSMWAFYLPVVAVMFYLRSAQKRPRIPLVRLGILILGAVFAKCLFNGYEYITSTLVMMAVPLVYYAILNGAGIRELFRGLGIAVLSSCLAVLLTFSILCVQIASVHGSLRDGMNYIVYSLEKRTYGDPQDFPENYAPGLEAEVAPVLATYLNATYFDGRNYLSLVPSIVFRHSLKVRYLYLIVLFAIASILLYLPALESRARPPIEKGGRKRAALVGATWFSILAPLSWFIIFKAHSYVHYYMNPIVWQMPFVFFGFAACGLAVRSVLPGRRGAP